MPQRSSSFRTALFIAGRYFFSPRGTHAVQVISLVALLSIAIVTMVMVVALSIFNGFERFTTEQFEALSPAMEIHRSDGSDFSYFSVVLPEGVRAAPVLTTQALVRFDGDALPVTLVGIDDSYSRLIPIEEKMAGGDFYLGDADSPSAVAGIGVATRLGVYAASLTPLTLILPKRLGRMSTLLPQRGFVTEEVPLTGLFRVDQEEDDQLIYLPIDLLRRMMMYSGDEVTYIATDLADADTLRQTLGEGYDLRDLYGQHPEAYRVLRVEKWVTFLMLLFVLCLCLFSVVSTLGLMILEKSEDTRILSALGATEGMTDRILRIESALLTVTGLVLGLVIGVALVLSQAAWGWFKMGGDPTLLLIDAYPVELRPGDLLLVTLVILLVGTLSTLIAHRLFARR